MPMGIAFNDYAKVRFIQGVKAGMSPRTVADDMDFSWRTIKEHLNADDEFRDLVEDAQATATAAIEDVLYKEAKGGNLGAVKMWLANRGVNWRDERDRTAGQSGPGEISVTVNLVAALREAMAQDDTRAAAIQMARELPAASVGG
jgi:hypothetical protein